MNKYKAIKNTTEKWEKVVNKLMTKSAAEGALLLNATPSCWCVPVDEDMPAMLLLVFPKGSKFAIHMLNRIEVLSHVTAVMQEVFDCDNVGFQCVEGDK